MPCISPTVHHQPTPASTQSSATTPIRAPDAVVDDLDGCALDAEHLADERRETGHRAAELPAEHLDELVGLLVARVLVDEHAELPVPFRHHLRRVRDRGDLEAGDVGPVDL